MAVQLLPVTGVLLDSSAQQQIRNATLELATCAHAVQPSHAATQQSINALYSACHPDQHKHTVLHSLIVPVSTLALGAVLLWHDASSSLGYNVYASRLCCSLRSGHGPSFRGPVFLCRQDGSEFLGSDWTELDHAVMAGLLPIFDDNRSGPAVSATEALASDDDESDADEEDGDGDLNRSRDSVHDDDSDTLPRHRVKQHHIRTQIATLTSQLAARAFRVEGVEAPDF